MDKGDIFKIVNINLGGNYIYKINILNISNYNNNINYEKKEFKTKMFIKEKKQTFYIEPFVLNKNIKYVLHLCKSDQLELIYNNYGGISINKTLEKNSTTNDVIEYTFENFDSNFSFVNYKYVFVIATDFETGYTYKYLFRGADYIDTIVNEENKSNTNMPLIIFGIIFGIFIIILIIVLVLRNKNMKKESLEIKNGILMDEEI